MCDQDDFDEFVSTSVGPRPCRAVSSGPLGVGAGLLSLVPAGAYAAETTGADVEIKTPDGTCDAYFAHPAKGKHPAVLIWPDIFGLRPAFKQMADRLAGSGYAVLVINPVLPDPEGTDLTRSSGFQRPGDPHQARRADAAADAEDGCDGRGRPCALAR